MLLCNGKLVDIDNKTNATSKFVREKFDELDALGWPIRLKFPDHLHQRVVTVDRAGNESFGWTWPAGYGI